MKKLFVLFVLTLALFSCKQRTTATENNGEQEVAEKAYIKSVSVLGQDVDIKTWKVAVPYKNRALEAADFSVQLSCKGANVTISPLPLKIEAGSSAKVMISDAKYSLSQEIELTMDVSTHKVKFTVPQDGYFTVLDEENKPVNNDEEVSNSTVLTLNATPKTSQFVVDCYKINGKKMFYGKSPVKLEVREDVNIEVSFVEKHKLSFVSVVDAPKHLIIRKDKWVDYFDWEDYPDVTVAPYAIGRTEVCYSFWKEIYDWAETKGYKFNNKGQNGAYFVSNQDTKPFDEDGNIYPATGMSQMDMWAWCNALTEFTNEKHKNEAGYVPLTYVYKHNGKRPPFTEAEPFKKSNVHFPKLSFPPPPEAYEQLQTAIDTAASIVIDRNATGFRLQNRIEWIVAARGGDPEAEAWKYRWPGSDRLEDVTEYFVGGQGKHRTLYPICQKIPNTLGLYDMVGNADEWTDSKHPNDPIANEVIGHASTDKQDEFEKTGWFQDVGGGLGYPWGGSATLGGGTNGWASTGFRLAITLK